ncbi:peptide chain release factor 1 [Candidatus Poribacteria bacterium]|nr:peptide chain release factor 1 [Candidatus Poribacteria bacterium]
MADLIEKLGEIEDKLASIDKDLGDPEVYSRASELERLGRMRSEIEPVATASAEYRKVLDELGEARELLETESDQELRDMALEEIEVLRERQEQLEEELRILLLPKDPNDEKNILLEIRAGAGGDEAALFAGELMRMYGRYAEGKRWKMELVNSNPTELGGFKEVVVSITGDHVYSRLKFESGVHRVQRVPETETSGRIHTSAVTVAVLPEAEEVDVEIKSEELRVDTFRAGGPGGQHANMTDSAVRMTHLPTGIMVVCKDERSQIKTRARAMKILLARLYDHMQAEQDDERMEARKSMVGSGDRSEKIRTYNFQDRRVTDHRIGLSLYQLDNVLDGGMDMVIDPLIAADQAEKLKAL